MAFLVHLVGTSLKLGKIDYELNNLKISLIDSSSHARNLDIENRRGEINVDYSLFKIDIDINAKNIQKALDTFEEYNSLLDISSLYDQAFLRDDLEIWELIHNKHFSNAMKFKNALKKFIYSSERVLTKDLKTLNLTDFDLYFIYSNPLRDMMRGCEASIELFEKNEEMFIKNMRSNLHYCLIGVGLVLVFSIGFIASKLYYVQKSSSSIWKFIYSISAYNLIELQRKALDRLCNVHLIDLEVRINRLPRRIK